MEQVIWIRNTYICKWCYKCDTGYRWFSIYCTVWNNIYPSTGLLVIEIGSHSLTTSNTIVIADGGITFTCDADNHASEHSYPRSGDPASGKILAITAVAGTTITVNVGISNDRTK